METGEQRFEEKCVTSLAYETHLSLLVTGRSIHLTFPYRWYNDSYESENNWLPSCRTQWRRHTSSD